MNSIIELSQATRWKYDLSHARIGFTVTHFGISETDGKFSLFTGEVISEKEDFSDAKIFIEIDVNSVITGDEKRDDHLRSADFFDISKFPTITFKSKSLERADHGKYKMKGHLILHGVTKEINLDAVYKGTVVDPFGNTKAGFRITGNIDRTEFGLTWGGLLAAGGLLVSNDVRLDINIELQRV